MENLLQADEEYILNVYKRLDFEVERGEGSYLIDKMGDYYLDLYSGLSVNNLGHRNEEVITNMIQQLNRYLHISNFFVSEPTVKLAKLLVENSFASKVFFTNSGTEANEAAIKLARKYGKSISDEKVEILAAEKSFHGRTYGAMTLTGQDKYKNMFTPILPGINHFEYNNLDSLEKLVSERTCAVFIELIQGESGVNEITEEFIKKLVHLKETYNFLICVDEIQTGIGRTGTLFAYEQYNFTPDVVTIAKSIGGGLPLGSMLVPNYLENIFKPGEHGTTFGGNPVACIGGIAVVKTVLDQSFQKEIIDKGNYILSTIRNLAERFPQLIPQVRGKGLMIGIEITSETVANEIKKRAKKKKILLNVANKTVIRLLPPLNISYDDINLFLNGFNEIIETIEKEQ